jgi:AraC-like DNA-binding protein
MRNGNYEKRGYLYEEFRLFHLRGVQGMRVDYHYHEFCKILLLLSGSGSYWIEGRQYLLQPGDVVFIGDGCPHRPDFSADTPYERIILYLSPEFLRKNSAPDCDLGTLFAGGGVLRPSSNGTRKLWQLAEHLETELSAQNFGSVILSHGLLLQLLVEAGRTLRRGDVVQPGKSLPKNGRVRHIMDYIDGHLTEDLSVDTIAEAFFLSKYHMMRLFQDAVGTGVHQYITQRRLELARELISSGISATDACYRSGFGTYSSFTRAYGKHFGTTPTGRRYAAGLQAESPE